MIICAAIKLKQNTLAGTEHIVCGLRHSDCFKTIDKMKADWVMASKTQGFITHTGEFLDRGQAWVHAIECGQVSPSAQWLHKDNNWPAELVSEDLW